MAKHQVFLVHGMGNFELGWSDAVKKRITDAFRAYPTLRDNGWVDKFEFKEITYDQVFESWRKQWREDAQAAANALTATGLNSDAASKLIQAAAAPGGSGFLATHVLDVVAFRFLPQVAQEVCRSVQSQILGHLKSLPSGDAIHYSVIAHSLGTSVTYESFHAMVTSGTDGNGTRLGTAFYPDNLFMVANVAKLLWNRGGTAYQHAMSPDLADGEGLCFSFSTFRHGLDPIPAVERFNPPDDWFMPTAPKSEVYLDAVIPAEDIQDINVHSFEHYLSHPLVHVPLLRTLTGLASNISQAEWDAALAAWRANRLGSQKLKAATKQLQELAVTSAGGWAPEIQMLMGIKQLALGSAFRDGES